MIEHLPQDDGFGVSFVVSTPRAKAWDLLADAAPADDGLGAARDGQWWIPAIEAPADELEVRPGELLRCRKAVEPCKGTEIVVALEDEDTGTRITIVQSGFGAGFGAQRAWLAAGWDTIVADFVLFFDRGVSIGRHASMWWSLGCGVEETDAGLVVTAVGPSGLARDAGLAPGDLLLRVAGSPILSVRDLAALTRGPLHTGVEVQVHYLRGDQAQQGVGRIA